jgi:hypothetical protein
MQPLDPSRRRLLKKLAKQRLEQQSQELRRELQEANPAPLGSDEWVRNYRTGVAREQKLRSAPPDRIEASDAAENFVAHEVHEIDEAHVGQSLPAAKTWYFECPRCHDLLHTKPSNSVSCRCGTVRLDHAAQTVSGPDSGLRIVSLIGRGHGQPAPSGPDANVDARSSRRRPWWRFW